MNNHPPGYRALTEAYNNQFNVPQLTGELTPQPSVRGMTKVSMFSSSALNMGGYLKIGHWRNPMIFCIKWGVLPDSSKFQHHVWFDMVKPVTSRAPISIPLRRSGHPFRRFVPFSRHGHRLLPLWRGVGAGSVGLWRGGGAEGFPDFGPDACAQTGACLDFSIGSSSESPAWSPGLNQRTVECLA